MSYRLREDSIHQHFMHSRQKLQFFGGGFGNGKTAVMCIKCLEVARAYPGANILMGRSTFPRLRDTLMKEFKKWCPADWIKAFPQSENSSKTCTLTNGTEINFRYVQQKGKGDETGDTKSNLLSATYDAIFVDQMEDPEITHKDFLDLLGRLRGNTKLDPTFRSELLGDMPLPLTGPRWFCLSANPTRNWLYKKIVKPLHLHNQGIFHEDLICLRDGEGNIILGEDKKPQPLIAIFEGSTYENKDNLGIDFIQLLESSYTGQMRKRFLMGEWAAYEGLVYDMYDPTVHQVTHSAAEDYFRYLIEMGIDVTILEAYDYGMAVPSCYLFAFVDPFGNVIVLDGFYEKKNIDWQITEIQGIRQKYLGKTDFDGGILADPSIFRRTAGGLKVVGHTVADIFWNNGQGVTMVRAANDIIHGIAKVQSYLEFHKMHKNPFTGETPAPFLYISDLLGFIDSEITEYLWHKDVTGETEDKPIDRKDHAMDTLKYLMTYRPRVAEVKINAYRKVPAYMNGWHEQDNNERVKGHRYGRTAH